MRVLIAGASPEPEGEAFYRQELSAADFVVAADAGAEWCVAHGRNPDLAVGDFDSAASGARKRLRSAGVEVIEYPAAKDESDLDLAVTAACARGADFITLMACSGGRLDHMLASLGTLLRAGAVLSADLQEPSFAAWPVGERQGNGIRLDMETGSVFSVFAIGEARDVAISGAAFPLACASLPSLSSLGLSNVAATTTVSVAVGGGQLVVIAQVRRDGPRPTLIPTS